MMANSLRHMLDKQPTGPCQTCRLRDACNYLELACDAFALFVGQPTRNVTKDWRRVEKSPSVAAYERIFRDDDDA